MANRDSVLDGKEAPGMDRAMVYSEILGWLDTEPRVFNVKKTP